MSKQGIIREKILAMDAGTTFTAREMARYAKCSESNAYLAIRYMMDTGFVHRRGSGTHVVYMRTAKHPFQAGLAPIREAEVAEVTELLPVRLDKFELNDNGEELVSFSDDYTKVTITIDTVDFVRLTHEGYLPYPTQED